MSRKDEFKRIIAEDLAYNYGTKISAKTRNKLSVEDLVNIRKIIADKVKPEN